MPQLRELQQTFCDDIYRKQSSLAENIVYANNWDGKQRLALYRSSVFGILTDALAAVYPVVQNLVGELFFEHLANRYIAAHPSRSGDLHHYGELMAEFLSQFEPVQELVYLPDVAQLEWHYHRVFHAADATPFNIDMLSELAPAQQESLCLALHPAARLMISDYPLDVIWQSNIDNKHDDVTIDLDTGGTALLVIRPQLQVEVQPITLAEYALLDKLQQGAALQSACEHSLTVDVDFDISCALYKHITQGTFIAAR